MSRILLLCFIHGFKGNDDTFRGFPFDLKKAVADDLPNDRVESIVYPKYETKGELAASTEAFVVWLKEQVVEVRKKYLEKPWPPQDRDVGVILVAHSMGGFVAVDALFKIVDDRRCDGTPPSSPMFPLIQGILAFDTPYNGLARSMFVYGAFSNYEKVSGVFNVMTALTAAAPAAIGRLGVKRGAASVAKTAGKAAGGLSAPGWKAWQLIAVRTGTVGAIAAGGVAAYTHRKEIIEGVRTLRNLKKEDIVQGYHTSIDRLGQGLAYINRGNVGASFAWLSDHFAFVGALMKQKELNRRLERMAALKGVGIRDVYISLGKNGYWSGGYFVPERNFCAIPAEKDAAFALFERHTMPDSEDEVQAHMSFFKPEKNLTYGQMTEDSAKLVVKWFNDETELFDDPKFSAPLPEEEKEKEVDEDVEKAAQQTEAEEEAEAETEADADALPDESPLDIAAAASLVPLPDDDGEVVTADAAAAASDKKRTYMQYLVGIAQQTGADVKLWSSRLSAMPKGQATLPTMPTLPAMPSMSNVTLPGSGLFSKKQKTDAAATQSEKDHKPSEKDQEGAEQQPLAPADPVTSEMQDKLVMESAP